LDGAVTGKVLPTVEEAARDVRSGVLRFDAATNSVRVVDGNAGKYQDFLESSRRRAADEMREANRGALAIELEGGIPALAAPNAAEAAVGIVSGILRYNPGANTLTVRDGDVEGYQTFLAQQRQILADSMRALNRGNGTVALQGALPGLPSPTLEEAARDLEKGILSFDLNSNSVSVSDGDVQAYQSILKQTAASLGQTGAAETAADDAAVRDVSALTSLTGLDATELAAEINRILQQGGGINQIRTFLVSRAQAQMREIRAQLETSEANFIQNLQTAGNVITAAIADLEAQVNGLLPASLPASEKSQAAADIAQAIRVAVLGELARPAVAGQEASELAAGLSQGALDNFSGLLQSGFERFNADAGLKKLFLVVSHAGESNTIVIQALNRYKDFIDNLIFLHTKAQKLNRSDLSGLNAVTQAYDSKNLDKHLKDIGRREQLFGKKAEFVFAEEMPVDPEFAKTLQSFLTQINQVPERLKTQAMDAVFLILFNLAEKGAERNSILKNSGEFEKFLRDLGLDFLAKGFQADGNGIQLNINGFINAIVEAAAETAAVAKAA
jgi:hypothetical protein